MQPQGRPGRFRLSNSAATVLLALVGICAAWSVAALGGGWVAGFLRSRLTLYAGGLLLGSAAALYLLAGAIWAMGRAGRAQRGRSRESGTAAIEFALVFPFALLISLIMIQSTLLVSGNLAVHYAAYAAARAAVVWVPEKLEDEPRNVVAVGGNSQKLSHIHTAAVVALVPVSAGKPGAGGAVGGGDAATIVEGVDLFFECYGSQPPNWTGTMLEAKLRYAWEYTEVTLFPPAQGGQYGDHEDLRVRVRHMLYLPVPYVNRIFGRALPAGEGDYATQVEASYALTNQGEEDEIDIEQFPRVVGKDEW